MKLKQIVVISLLICCTTLFQFCSKSGITTSANTVSNAVIANSPIQLPTSPYNYANVVYPAYLVSALSGVDNTPITNAITNDGATLGRVLFYDKNLSANNTVSCASCHNQNLSFTDTAIFSKGFQGGKTARHSMRLLNVRFYKSGKMFWDERSATLEDQVLQPIQNTTEMGLTLTELVTRVSSLSYYPSLFQKAFGSTQVNTDRISKALAQFVRSIVTYQSKYDLVKQGITSFTTDESDGETIFLTRGAVTCAGCHTPPMFLTSEPLRPFSLPDASDAGINNQNRFKSGSLRNIDVSGPLFHNGSISGLQTMLVAGIPAHNVAPPDRQKLIAFLQTLTDQTSIKDVKFSNPFVNP
jgi:cytochrome c peroxidase